MDSPNNVGIKKLDTNLINKKNYSQNDDFQNKNN